MVLIDSFIPMSSIGNVAAIFELISSSRTLALLFPEVCKNTPFKPSIAPPFIFL